MKQFIVFLSAIVAAASATDMKACLADRGHKLVKRIMQEQMTMSGDRDHQVAPGKDSDNEGYREFLSPLGAHAGADQSQAHRDAGQMYEENVARGIEYWTEGDMGKWNDERWLEYGTAMDRFANHIRDWWRPPRVLVSEVRRWQP